jgi:Flp pilus assembly protein TadD
LALAAALLIVALVGSYRLVFQSGVSGDLEEGERAVANGRPDMAEAAFRRVLSAEPENEQAMYGIGWAWHMGGQDDQAREAFNLLQQIHPDSPLGYKGLGSVWMGEGNTKEARRSFEHALELAANRPDYDAVPIENSLALVDLSSRNGEAALAAYDALVGKHPDRAEFHLGRAEALLMLGRNDDARIAAEDAVRRAPDEGVVRANSLVTRARALLAASGGRVNASDCKGTAPPVYAWLDAADHDLDQAESLGVAVPSIPNVRRSIRERRGGVDDTCPGVRAIALPAGSGN